MLCVACDCVAVKTWPGVLPFWTDGALICQAWLCCFQGGHFVSYVGAREINLLEVFHLYACFHQLPGVGAICDVQLVAGFVHRIREPCSAAAAAAGVLSLPWFEAFQSDCCERHPYGMPAVTPSTVYWRVMGRRVMCGMCTAFILMDQTWQWQYVSVLLIWLKLSTAANFYQN